MLSVNDAYDLLKKQYPSFIIVSATDYPTFYVFEAYTPDSSFCGKKIEMDPFYSIQKNNKKIENWSPFFDETDSYFDRRKVYFKGDDE